MPTISVFFGITIQMFWNDHEPPHLHATHGDMTATIGIDSAEVLSGGLPTSSIRLVKKWVALHQGELQMYNVPWAVVHVTPLPDYKLLVTFN